MTTTPASYRASVTIGSEATARRVADLMHEAIVDDVAVSAFERPDGRWDITLDFAEAPNEAAIRALVAAAADQAAADALAFSAVSATDWVAKSLEGLQPVAAGRFLVHGAHDRARAPPNKIGIEIEAALAFGTGHHGTTRGCLLLLDDVLKRRAPHAMFDLGCGSGVLAIAAAKATRRPVLASDIDAASVRVARENARLNGVGPLVDVVVAAGFAAPEIAQEAPFDLVLANILANPLRMLAHPMAAHLAKDAAVILSGLLPHQARGVIAAYRGRGLRLRRHLVLDGWSSLLLET